MDRHPTALTSALQRRLTAAGAGFRDHPALTSLDLSANQLVELGELSLREFPISLLKNCQKVRTSPHSFQVAFPIGAEPA